MALVVSHWSLTVETSVQAKTLPCRICGGQSSFLWVKVNIKFTLLQATKAQRGRRCIAVLFLQHWH